MSKFAQHDSDHDRDASSDRGRSQGERPQSKTFKQQAGKFGRRRAAPAGFNGIHRRRRRRLDW